MDTVDYVDEQKKPRLDYMAMHFDLDIRCLSSKWIGALFVRCASYFYGVDACVCLFVCVCVAPLEKLSEQMFFRGF